MSIFRRTEEDRIRKEIYAKAMKMAEESYHKEIMFRTLQASDLHYAIIQDLMKAASFTGLVTITLKDGTAIKIESKDGPRDRLSQLDGATF